MKHTQYSFLHCSLEHCKSLLKSDDTTSSFPEVEDIQEGRKEAKTWTFIIIEFLRYIVPESKNCLANQPLQEWCPAAAEALLFLMIENSYEMWMEEAENDENDDKTPTKMAKWTERRGSGRRFGGWSNEGIKRFNELYSEIKRRRRNKETGKNLEEKLMEKANELGMSPKKRKHEHTQDGEEPMYDMPTEFTT